jgi:hypothetical protein
MSISVALLPTSHVRSVVVRRSRPAPAAPPVPALRLVTDAPTRPASSASAVPWWQRRAETRKTVGGCPVHWWNPTARTTAACTCDRFV